MATIIAAFLVACALMVLASLAARASPAAGCMAGHCVGSPQSAMTPQSRIMVADIELSESQRRSRIKRCCRRVEAGYPPKGYLCSYRQVERAYREGICIPRR